jgi:hypothetical protein
MARARSIIVSRKHVRDMAIAVASISYRLRDLGGMLFVLSGQLRPGGPGADTHPSLLDGGTPNLLMTMHEILRDDAEYLDHMKVFLGHRLYQEAPLATTKAHAKMIGDGTSASR